MLIRSLLPDCVLVLEADPSRADFQHLYPEERWPLERAGVIRQSEYAAGRLLARELLARLGVGNGPFLDGEDGAPRWPEGVVGSISHCSSLCSVAIARRTDVGSLGIDIEQALPLDEASEALVVQPEDGASMSRFTTEVGSLAGKLVFSAKEAAYKAVYPIIHRFLEFPEVIIREGGGGRFTPVVRVAAAELPALRGRYCLSDGFIATAVLVAPVLSQGTT